MQMHYVYCECLFVFYRLRFFFFFFGSKGAPKNLFVTVGPFIYLYVLGNEQKDN